MYKLILHHTYKMMGEAVDISRNENHGFRTAVPYLPDGRSPGTGVLEYTGGPSRVRVRNKPVWQNLRSIKIEMWVKLTALGQRRNLVEGDASFAFFIHPDGVLWGTFFDPGPLSPPTPGSSPNWPGANSDTGYSPDGVRHTVPLNKWTKLTYVHDGIASLRLYIDDKLVGANYDLRAPVTSVKPNGVHIGHWPGDDRYTFSGEIDEIKIWKYDPDVPYKQFFCRPMKGEQMKCWEAIFDNMAGLLEDQETRRSFIGYLRCIGSAQEELVRLIRSKGEDAIARSNEFSRRYRDLWCSGKIDSRGMENFFNDWLAWIYEILGEEAFQEFRKRVENCLHEYGNLKLDQLAPKDMANCDPDFAAYIQILEKILSAGPKPPAPGLLERLAKIIGYIIGLLQRWFGKK